MRDWYYIGLMQSKLKFSVLCLTRNPSQQC